MSIIHYLSLGLLGLGVVVVAIATVYGLSAIAATATPPASQDAEDARGRTWGVATRLLIVGALLCGVGVLFR
jgi:hypothetical protein